MILTIPHNIYHRYNSRVIILFKYKEQEYYIVHSDRVYSEIHYMKNLPKEFHLRCAKCLTQIKRVKVTEKYFIVDAHSCNINPSSVTIDMAMLFSVSLCEKCEKNKLQITAAPILCNTCSKIVSWMLPQDYKGFKIKAGVTYHIEQCSTCNPNVKQKELIELSRYLANNHLSYDNIDNERKDPG